MEIKYMEADDGFALLVQDEYEFKIIINNDKFNNDGSFQIEHDDADPSDKVTKNAHNVMNFIISNHKSPEAV